MFFLLFPLRPIFPFTSSHPRPLPLRFSLLSPQCSSKLGCFPFLKQRVNFTRGTPGSLNFPCSFFARFLNIHPFDPAPTPSAEPGPPSSTQLPRSSSRIIKLPFLSPLRVEFPSFSFFTMAVVHNQSISSATWSLTPLLPYNVFHPFSFPQPLSSQIPRFVKLDPITLVCRFCLFPQLFTPRGN